MIMVECHINDNITEKDLEDIKTLYNDDDIIFNDNIFLDVIDEYIDLLINSSNNYLIEDNETLLKKDFALLNETEKQLYSIISRIDNDLFLLLLMRLKIKNNEYDILEKVTFSEEREYLQLDRQKMLDFYNKFKKNFRKNDKIIDDIICFSESVVL